MARPPIKNRILTTLSLSDLDPLRAFLQPVMLEKGAVLNEANRAIEHINFIESGLVSLMTLAKGRTLETAMVGHQGVVGASIALGGRLSIHKSVVLVPGTALRIHRDELQRTMAERPKIREHLLRYLQSLMIHGSQTALCGVCHQLEQRLACWLCLACDLLDGEALAITHDHLSYILGLRRASVTEALMRFEDLGLVRKARGLLQVRERQSLEQRACGCYGIISNAYEKPATRQPEIDPESISL